jgi:hypothetical protein
VKRAAHVLAALLLLAGTAYADPIPVDFVSLPPEWAALLCEALLAD